MITERRYKQRHVSLLRVKTTENYHSVQQLQWDDTYKVTSGYFVFKEQRKYHSVQWLQWEDTNKVTSGYFVLKNRETTTVYNDYSEKIQTRSRQVTLC